MMLHNKAFAWDNDEQGHFHEDFFPPIDISVVPHKPWVKRNIRIPPGLYDELCKLVKQKIDAGVFEPSNSSHRSRWFCVLKKYGKSLWIVQSLELLNKVTIAHSGVPPFTEQLAEQFAGCTCNSMMDLYAGYDKHVLAPSSRDLTTFQLPTILEYPALCLETFSRPQLCGTVNEIKWRDLLQVQVHTVSLKIMVLGHRCTAEGQLPDKNKLAKIVNQGPCKDLTDVCTFVGTIGVCRLFIKNFTHWAHYLVKLTRK